MKNTPKNVKVALFYANKEDGYLEIDREFRDIQEKIRTSPFKDSIELIPSPAARLDDVVQAILEHDLTVIHYSGHGTPEGELTFIDDDDEDNTIDIDTETFCQIFSSVDEQLKLIVLNACHSSITATELVKSVSCVIGMLTDIDDIASRIFSVALYRGLVLGRSVSESFHLGRLALKIKQSPDLHVPVIMCMDGVDASNLYLFRRQEDIQTNNIKELLKKAEALMLSSQHQEAMEIYKACLEIEENLPEALLGRALCFVSMGLLDGAMAVLDNIFENISRRIPGAYRVRALIYSQRGVYQDSLKDLTTAIEQEPTNPENYLARARILNLLDENQKAIDDYKEALKLKPNDSKVLNNLALSYRMVSDLEVAASTLEKAISFDSESGFVA